MANGQMTGVAGVHYVVSYLNYLEFHAVPTVRNVPGPDVLLSTLSGSKGISLQVKTTRNAMRTRGLGKNKKPHEYQWDIGWKSAKISHSLLFFALVDLKEFRELPDVFIVPSQVIFEYFETGPNENWTRARYHPKIEENSQYKNNWDILREALKTE